MKKNNTLVIIGLLVSSFFFVSCRNKDKATNIINSDISTTEEKFDISILLNNDTVADGQFDSTLNYLGNKNVETYIGQTLLVLPPVSPDIGYMYFHEYVSAKKVNSYIEGGISKATAFAEWKHYGKASKSYNFWTATEALSGKSFIVDSVMHLKGEDYLFALTNKDDNEDKCYFIYDESNELDFPFLVVSHYNYLVTTLVGNYYYLNGEHNPYRCNDIVTEKHHYCAELVSSNDTIYTDTDDFRYTKYGKHIFEKSVWEKCVKAVGEDYMKYVTKKWIKIGMPETLVYCSLGEFFWIDWMSETEKELYYEERYGMHVTNVIIKDGKVTAYKENGSWHK